MQLISIISATTLTNRSERTLWRWIADGTLKRGPDDAAHGRTTVHLDSVKPYLCLPVGAEDWDLIISADVGNAEAQNDLALLFLSHGKPESAIYWLDLAAKQDYADAMHWMGRCYIEGKGLPKDENLGIMWLSKAAAHGHVISQAQMQAMRDSFVSGGYLNRPEAEAQFSRRRSM